MRSWMRELDAMCDTVTEKSSKPCMYVRPAEAGKSAVADVHYRDKLLPGSMDDLTIPSGGVPVS
jgi:hypothetical protein